MSLEGKTGHYLSADRMYVYGIVNGEIFSRYQVSALLQNGPMPKLTTPGSPLGWTPSRKNDAVKWIDALEKNGYVLEAPKGLGIMEGLEGLSLCGVEGHVGSEPVEADDIRDTGNSRNDTRQAGIKPGHRLKHL